MADDHGYEAVKNEGLADAVRKLVEKGGGSTEDPKPTRIIKGHGIKRDPK